ncbi:uncharacterized protein I303_105761 [Kwoniella dejecticola CBS 10117]|uniref:Uncharacterized protein n=1 Tax=Kwoniella dejecticola CBS 10117 TaxID=1296121 RepID=A0AAJ8KSX0_9TREE
MKPSPTLIPRLLPIFKHFPTAPASATASSSSSSHVVVVHPPLSKSSMWEGMQHRERDGDGAGDERHQWWLANTFQVKPKSQTYFATHSTSTSTPQNNHIHLQSSLNYHHPHPHHQRQMQYHPSSIYTSSTHLTPNIRFNDSVASNDQAGRQGTSTNVPPPTIAWNDHLSMI